MGPNATLLQGVQTSALTHLANRVCCRFPVLSRRPEAGGGAMGRLEERVIIVTGGAHGIGRAYCEGLAREAARVVVADIDGRGAETVAEALSTGGQEALAVQGDVGQA